MSKMQANNIQIAYIGGGSRGWAWRLMSDLALEPDLAGTVKLYDIDYHAACNNETIGNRLTNKPETKGRWTYQAVESLEEALDGANFIIMSILPGTFDEMAVDVHLPEKYGIFQSVGDSTGPGGLLRALRTIPIYLDFAERIKAAAPDAWVINYTNPMSLSVRALYHAFPGIKAFGCCHEVFGTQELLVKMLKSEHGIADADRGKIRTNVLGINHFTWIDGATYENIDLFPLYRRFVEKYHASGFEEKPGHWETDFFSSANRVKFDLFQRYGWMAAAGDRHLAEFVPWYLRDKETVRSWKFQLTPVEWRVKNRAELIARSERLTAGTEQFKLDASGEEGVKLIKALVGMGDFISNVNLPNRGQIGNLPQGAVVETNALFGYDSIRPVHAGNLTPEIQNLTIRHVLNHETVIQAFVRQDKEMVFRALMNDPLVIPDTVQMRELFDEMLQKTRQFLPDWLV